MNEIKTSVIIPVYNTEQYLETCIESVLAQTQKEIEIILVDDGSTDGSRQIIEKYKKKYTFIKTIYQENQKQGAARNAGVKISCGKYIYFLDSDDYIKETLFETCYHIAEKNKLDFVMFDAERFAEDEEEASKYMYTYTRNEIGIEDTIYAGSEFWNRYYQKNGVRVNAYLVYMNAEFLKNNKLFFEPEIFYEDNDWMLRTYMCAQKIKYYPHALYYRRIRAGSTMTANYTAVHFRSIIAECKKMIQMLLEEREGSRQKMIYLHVKEMLLFFIRIFECCRKEERLNEVHEDILDFYGFLLKRYIRIIIHYPLTEVIDITEMLKIELERCDFLINPLIENFEEDKKETLSKLFCNYSLENKELRIGIYGTGILCEKFLALYQKYSGDILAEIVFIDTFKKSGGSYNGYPVYNLQDIKEMRNDVILIASIRYWKEMLENIKVILPQETKVLVIPDYLQYFI